MKKLEIALYFLLGLSMLVSSIFIGVKLAHKHAVKAQIQESQEKKQEPESQEPVAPKVLPLEENSDNTPVE